MMSVPYTRALAVRLPPLRDGDPADGVPGTATSRTPAPLSRPGSSQRWADPATPPALTSPAAVPLRQAGTTAELTSTAEPRAPFPQPRAVSGRALTRCVFPDLWAEGLLFMVAAAEPHSESHTCRPKRWPPPCRARAAGNGGGTAGGRGGRC